MEGATSPSFEYVPCDDSVLLVTYDVTDVNGRASVAIFSGTKAGTVRIKATSVDNINIFKEKPIITIESGPPATIEIYPSNIASQEGEALITGITAAVWDQYTNPVEPLTAVHFEIIPDTVAYIGGAAYTGGWVDEATGDTIGVRGLAHTSMTYGCYHTFDSVRVVASSGELEDTSGVIVLALYEGQIALGAQPSTIYVDEGMFETASITAQLLDGLGCPIHNGIIDFSVRVCGEISGPYVDTTDSDGYAYTEFKIYHDQIPAQPPPAPPSCEAKIVAILRGYPEVQSEWDIFCVAK